MRLKILSISALVATLVLGACNLSSGGTTAAQVQTAAAETVGAQLTLNSQLTPSSTSTPVPTATLTPSNTSAVITAVPTRTTSGGGTSSCDVMAFVSDVTVPDGTKMAPDTAFVKTWRIRNSGTCSWTTSYSLVFNSGHSMNGPAAQALAANVAPNSTIDISVNLKAPAITGSYTGYWVLRNTSGQNFGSLFVVIDVVTGNTTSSVTPMPTNFNNTTPSVTSTPTNAILTDTVTPIATSTP